MWIRFFFTYLHSFFIYLLTYILYLCRKKCVIKLFVGLVWSGTCLAGVLCSQNSFVRSLKLLNSTFFFCWRERIVSEILLMEKFVQPFNFFFCCHFNNDYFFLSNQRNFLINFLIEIFFCSFFWSESFKLQNFWRKKNIPNKQLLSK